NGAKQIAISEDSHVVVQPDPGHRANPIPAEKRILNAHEKWEEYEHRVHHERRHDKEPADEFVPADRPAKGGLPGGCDGRRLIIRRRCHDCRSFMVQRRYLPATVTTYCSESCRSYSS